MRKLVAVIAVLSSMFLFQLAQAERIIDSDAIEFNVDRPGPNMTSFLLPVENPLLCRDACYGNPNCLAWTYSLPESIPDFSNFCFLKGGDTSGRPPAAAPNTCCISGVNRGGHMEFGYDRRGGTGAVPFALPVANPWLCRDACAGTPECTSWTFVQPGMTTVPEALCALNTAPAATPVEDACCVSGIR